MAGGRPLLWLLLSIVPLGGRHQRGLMGGHLGPQELPSGRLDWPETPPTPIQGGVRRPHPS